jgi:hypothetical protein
MNSLCHLVLMSILRSMVAEGGTLGSRLVHMFIYLEELIIVNCPVNLTYLPFQFCL